MLYNIQQFSIRSFFQRRKGHKEDAKIARENSLRSLHDLKNSCDKKILKTVMNLVQVWAVLSFPFRTGRELDGEAEISNKE